MNISDYVLNDQKIEEIREKSRKKSGKKKVRRRAKAEYSILFQSGCDFGIEKRLGNKISSLIMLVSKEQYYITNGKDIRELNIPLFRSFFSGLGEDLELPEVDWLSGIPEAVGDFGNRVFRSLRNHDSRKLIRSGCLYVYSDDEIDNMIVPGGYYNTKDIARLLPLTSVSLFRWMIDFMAKRRGISRKVLFREILWHRGGLKENKLITGFPAFVLILNYYGIEWAKKAIQEYLDSTLESGLSIQSMSDLINAFAASDSSTMQIIDTFKAVDSSTVSDFDPDMVQCEDFCRDSSKYMTMDKNIKKKLSRGLPAHKMIDYLMHHSCSEGYAYSMGEFVSDWKKYIAIQKLLYGRIRDKYPEYLKSSLNKALFMYKLNEEKIQKEIFDAVAEKMKQYEYSDGTYTIMAPKDQDDIIQEAASQHNCLVGYVKTVLREEDMILFMRKCGCENKSLVTIEVSPTGHVGQIFGKCNRNPSDEEMNFIREWAGQKNLMLPRYRIAPRRADAAPGDWGDDQYFDDQFFDPDEDSIESYLQ